MTELEENDLKKQQLDGSPAAELNSLTTMPVFAGQFAARDYFSRWGDEMRCVHKKGRMDDDVVHWAFILSPSQRQGS